MASKKQGSVTVRLKGGLGNQLFQYASGKALATRLNCDFFTDTTFYTKENNSNRKLKLPALGVSPRTNSLTKGERNKKIWAGKLLPSSLNGNFNYIAEPADYAYHAFDADPTQQTYLDGYWQSEKYFIDIRAQLLAEIDLSNIEKLRGAAKLPSDNTVAVHVRRGDFITSKSSQALSVDYYKNAMSEFGNNADFMFFSDDIDWCKENFQGNNLSFATNRTDLQDLKQMSEAAHNIIANSTFSWWRPNPLDHPKHPPRHPPQNMGRGRTKLSNLFLYFLCSKKPVFCLK